jgi:hypothetical protein
MSRKKADLYCLKNGAWQSRFFPCRFFRASFTLIELVVVCAIIALAVGLGMVSLRSSGGAKFERTVDGFQEFCSGARMQAMELGRDRVIYFNRKERKFRAGDPERLMLPNEDELVYLPDVPEEYRTDEDEEWESYQQPRTLASLFWTIPEEYRMGQEDEETGWVDVTEGHEEQEVFRFFSDGGASGALKFTLTYGKFSRTFSISPLTGRMLTEENAEEGGRP